MGSVTCPSVFQTLNPEIYNQSPEYLLRKALRFIIGALSNCYAGPPDTHKLGSNNY